MNIPPFPKNNKILAIEIIYLQTLDFLLHKNKELLVIILITKTESSGNLGRKFSRKFCLNFYFLVMFIVLHPSGLPNVQNPRLIIYIFVQFPFSRVYVMSRSH